MNEAAGSLFDEGAIEVNVKEKPPTLRAKERGVFSAGDASNYKYTGPKRAWTAMDEWRLKRMQRDAQKQADTIWHNAQATARALEAKRKESL
jgi:hypothetical protein